MKRYSTLYIIRELQIKMMRYYYTPIRMDKFFLKNSKERKEEKREERKKRGD